MFPDSPGWAYETGDHESMASMNDKDYYAILGVDHDATEEQIRKAFQQKARKLHPDINKEPDAEERFKEVSEAYAVLSDPDKRRRYDAMQSGNPFAASGPTIPRLAAMSSTSLISTRGRPGRAAARALPISATSRARSVTVWAPCTLTTRGRVPLAVARATSRWTSRVSLASAS